MDSDKVQVLACHRGSSALCNTRARADQGGAVLDDSRQSGAVSREDSTKQKQRGGMCPWPVGVRGCVGHGRKTQFEQALVFYQEASHISTPKRRTRVGVGNQQIK